MTYSTYLFQKKYVLGIIIFITGIIIYSPSIEISFFSDEIAFIERNEVDSAGEVFQLFGKKDYDREYYRPLVNFTSGLLTSVFGYSPVWYRIFNLLLHSLNGILLFLFANRLLSGNENRDIISFTAAILFVAFPLHDLAVIWHTDLFDRMMFTFYITSLLLFINNYEPTAASLVMFLLSLLSKEMAFSLPLLIITADFFLNDGRLKSSLTKSLPYFIAALLFILFRIALFGNNIFSSGALHSQFGIIAVVKNYIFFAGMLVFPFFTYSVQEIVKSNLLLFSIPFILIGISSLYFISKKLGYDRVAIFLLLFIVVSILPASRLLMKWYLYLPSAGFTIMLSYMVFTLLKKRTALFIASFVVMFYCIGIISIQIDWVKLTNHAKETVDEFIRDYRDEISVNEEIAFLTIPAKVDNYPVLHLQFDRHLAHYLEWKKDIEILSRSNISNFDDKIGLNSLDSIYTLIHDDGNYFILFGYEKNIRFVDSDFENGHLRKIRFTNRNYPNAAIFTFTNGKFKRIEQ